MISQISHFKCFSARASSCREFCLPLGAAWAQTAHCCTAMCSVPHLHCSADLCPKYCQPVFSEKENHCFSRGETLMKKLMPLSWSCLCHTGWKGWKGPSFGTPVYKCRNAKFGQLCNIYSFTLLLCLQRELILDTHFLSTFKNHSQHKKISPSQSSFSCLPLFRILLTTSCRQRRLAWLFSEALISS